MTKLTIDTLIDEIFQKPAEYLELIRHIHAFAVSNDQSVLEALTEWWAFHVEMGTRIESLEDMIENAYADFADWRGAR